MTMNDAIKEVFASALEVNTFFSVNKIKKNECKHSC